MFKILQYIILIIISGLILPLVLIPVIQLIPIEVSWYKTEIIEEITKSLVVFFLILKLSTTKHKIWAGVLFGFLFGLSESMFYLNNIVQLGDFSVFWQRILWTVPMHIITVLVMVLAGLFRKWLLIFGFIIAVILHLGFNLSL